MPLTFAYFIFTEEDNSSSRNVQYHFFSQCQLLNNFFNMPGYTPVRVFLMIITVSRRNHWGLNFKILSFLICMTLQVVYFNDSRRL